jgi:hypothetical protein
VSASLRFLTDEDFRGRLLRGLQRRKPELDVLRAQDEELSGRADPAVLEWAAQHDRVVLTHDTKTMPGHAYARVGAGLRMPGVCVVPQNLPIRVAIEELLTVIECSVREDLENQVLRLPL